MTFSSLVLVGLKPETRALAIAAAARVAPGATVSEPATLAEAKGRAGASRSADDVELLVLEENDPTIRRVASQAADAHGLPRWGVIDFGSESSADGDQGVVAVTVREPATVALIFRQAAAHQRAARENARLRGDLHTLAVRLSHDLRTPLGCVSTTTEVLRETLAERGAEDGGLTQAIADSTAEMAGMIERVSFVVRATARPLARESMLMEDAVLGALQLLEFRLRETGAVVREPASWPEVFGVATWLRAVWWNLLHNVLQHAGPKPVVGLGWAESAEGFRFWVEDRGPGIPEEKRGRLFQPFHLMHEASAPRGFGLAIAQRLMELQGGRCTYEPGAAGGARFGFFLPR